MTRKEKLLLLLQLRRDVLKANEGDQIANSNIILTITIGIFATYFGITQLIVNFPTMNDIQRSLAVTVGLLAVTLAILFHLDYKKVWRTKEFAVELTMKQINDTLRELKGVK